ncbi:hypothetical protein CQW23_25070 [Capsicum baccatum]|uniref:Uncharacterized protein n=1 Tax=Capsicum baccatum TaxID=33114 RepID=A0A2G2VWK9_CAPBA|nr:hypothetical protein CQW23_25070 [Capsicum baccatum]
MAPSTQMDNIRSLSRLPSTSRMKGKKDKEQREAAKELKHSNNIVKAPAALNKEPSLIPPAQVLVTEKQSEENRMEE